MDKNGNYLNKDEEQNEDKKDKKKSVYYYLTIAFSIIIIILLFVVGYLCFIYKKETNKSKNLEKKFNQESNNTKDLEKEVNNVKKQNIELNNKLKNAMKINFELKKKNSNILYSIIPSFVKSYSQGVFDFNYNGLKRLSDNIIFNPEEKFDVLEIHNNQIYELMGNIDSSIKGSIAIFNSEANLKLKIDQLESESYKSVSMVGQQILGNININQKDIILDEGLLNKIQYIANDISLDKERKAEKLEEIFENYGYYIPLTYYLGGMFIIEVEDFSNNENKGIDTGDNFNSKNDKINRNAILQYYERDIGKTPLSRSNQFIFGGNSKAKTFDEWRFSVNKTNSNIIGIGNIIKITQLFDPTLRKELDEPLKLIKQKLIKRRIYYENYKTIIKKRNSEYKKDYEHNAEEIIFQKDEMGLIEVFEKSLIIEGDLKYNSYHVFIKSFEGIIVGWRVTNTKENNFEYSFKECPLFNQKLEIRFRKGFTEKTINIEIFYMKFPK